MALPPEFDREMRALLGEGWLHGGERLQAYGDEYRRETVVPEAVAIPADRGQVQALVRACRRHGVPIVARGAGTNTTGATVPAAGSVVLSFERMDRILSIRPGDRCAVVEPGLSNGALQEALRAHGLFWPPDPTSADICTVGGNLACNAGGPRAVKYGATRDNVLALTAVTGTGELVELGSATTKDSTGYDLQRLLVGSEGTLALIVEATLKLSPLPRDRQVLRAMYRDVDSAATAVARLMAQPVVPSMVEFMDGESVRLARDVGGADLPDGVGAMLLLEADGDPDALPAALLAIGEAATVDGLLDIETGGSTAARERLWSARKALSPALRTIAAGKINEDVVVPVSRIPGLVAGVQAISRRCGLPIVTFGHAGNGNLHVNIMYDPGDAGQSRAAHAALPDVFALALELGGTLSGEHGIGLAKRGFMASALGPEALALMRGVKRLFDPDGILNPGKVLP